MQITRPTLLVDKDKALGNLKNMADRAAAFGVKFSPHMKSHQSHDIAKWYRQFGVESITVSSLTMASYFSKDGWNQIMVAFPVNPGEIDIINNLASKGYFTVLVNSEGTADKLSKELTADLHFYIEIDTGYPRTGVRPNETERIQSIISKARQSQHLKWRGFYSHPGHSYDASSLEEIRLIHQNTIDSLIQLQEEFSTGNFRPELSMGDTPTCSTATHFNGIDEIRPGNFVFYDLSQAQIGSCKEENISICMAVPVVEKIESRNEIIVHGGAVHFSKDFLIEDNIKVFGKYAEFTANGWSDSFPGNYLKSVSQEHGVLAVTSEVFKKLNVGDSVGILPAHSCLTADLMGGFITTTGESLNQLRQL